MYGVRSPREGAGGDREVLEALFGLEAPRLDREQSEALRAVDPEVLAGLQRVLDRLLAKERSARYGDAQEVCAELGALQRRCEGETEPRTELSRLMKTRFAKAEESMRAALQLPPSALAKARQRSAPFPVVDARIAEDTRVLSERRDVDSDTRQGMTARPITQDLEPLTPTPSQVTGVGSAAIESGSNGSVSSGIVSHADGSSAPPAGLSLRSRGAWMLLAVAAVAGVALLWGQPWQRASPETRAPSRDAAVERAEDRPQDLVEVAPARVTWHMESDPPGAEVWVDDQRIGDVTPLDVVLDRGDTIVRVEVRLAEHRTRTFDLAPLGDHSFSVELVPSPPVHTQMATAVSTGATSESDPPGKRSNGRKKAGKSGDDATAAKGDAAQGGAKSATDTQPSGFKPMPDFGGERREGDP
jgi:hypothetical protein